MSSVWIVFTEAPEEPQTILGVFENARSADEFAQTIAANFPTGGVLTGQYEIGWTYDGRSSRYTR